GFLRAADRIKHRADGAFAIRSGDVDEPLLAPVPAERIEQTADIFQPELDAVKLRRVEPRERLPVVHCCAVFGVRYLIKSESVERIFLRCTMRSTKPRSSKNSAV